MSIDRDLQEAEAKAAGFHNLAWYQDRLRVETSQFNGHEPDWFYWDTHPLSKIKKDEA